MNSTGYSPINVTFHEFEGFSYIEFEGTFYKGCKRCGGSGHYSFDGYSSECYACGNTSAKLGDDFSSEAEAQKWCHGKALRRAQRDRKREQERLALVAEMVANQEYLKAEAPEVYEFLMAFDAESDRNSFLRNMASVLQYVGLTRKFTPNMIEATRKAMAALDAKLADQEAHPVPEGRITITGEIIGTKVVEGDYGTAYKITVKDDAGYRVWVSLPKAQADEARDEFFTEHEDSIDAGLIGYSVWFAGSTTEPERFTGVKGRRITFTASVEASHDDKSFGFGKRPTKGSWI